MLNLGSQTPNPLGHMARTPVFLLMGQDLGYWPSSAKERPFNPCPNIQPTPATHAGDYQYRLHIPLRPPGYPAVGHCSRLLCADHWVLELFLAAWMQEVKTLEGSFQEMGPESPLSTAQTLHLCISVLYNRKSWVWWCTILSDFCLSEFRPCFSILPFVLSRLPRYTRLTAPSSNAS